MTSPAVASVLAAMMSVALLTAVIPNQPQADARAAATRTVAYLRTEVPRWRREHPCYSCHNNGDATRALLAASTRGHAVADAIDDTVAWLATPERWDTNARRGESEEQPLARIQFASALAAMLAVGRAEADALDRAAGLLVVHQEDDGSWRLSDTQMLGGATFYGTSLATGMARRILVRAKTASVRSPLAKASGWLRTSSPITVLDASAVLLGLERDSDPAAASPTTTVTRDPPARPGSRRRLGPYVTSQSERRHALALLALAGLRPADALSTAPYSTRELGAAIERGRAALLRTPEPGRQLARNDPATQRRQLRATHLDDRVGTDGAARIRVTVRWGESVVAGRVRVPGRSKRTENKRAHRRLRD